MSDLRTRFRGALGNILVWGIGWTGLGLSTTVTRMLTGAADAPTAIGDAVGIALKIGVGGAIAGAAFSAFIAFAYRHRRVQDISWWRFGIGGAVVTALSITGFVQGASLLGGSGLVPWRYMNPTLGLFVLFGFSAAAISLRLAQSATSRVAGGDDEPSGDLAQMLGAPPAHIHGAGVHTDRQKQY